MQPISLISAASHLPETIVGNDFFSAKGDAADHPMFKGSVARRHISEKDSAASLISQAAVKLIDQLNLTPQKDIDILLTNVSLPDLPFTGCGAEVAKQLGVNPQWVIDIHNGGCVSFIYMIDIARALMAGANAKTALICNAQTAAGRVFRHPQNREQPQSAIPGDGAGVAYLVANESSPVLSLKRYCHSEYASDMRVASRPDAQWWSPSDTPLRIEFNENKIASIIDRGNRLVPKVMYEAIAAAELGIQQIDRLVTNQPNPTFLRNWRESICMDNKGHHIHTFPDHGNLFGAAFPISIERGLADGRLKPGHRLLLGGFSHAADYTAAAVVHWHAGS